MFFLSRCALLIMAFWSAVACADPNYAGNESAQVVINQLVEEEGFDRVQLEAVFANAERKDSIIEAMSRPAEKTKAWYEYRAIFLTDKREQQGLVFFEQHRETLARAEQEFGVPAEIIVAIIGVETSYGSNTGSYRVIDALSTLAFDYPKRSTFFTKELKHYLILTRDQGLDPLTMKGSYAGAMGFGQFMPSSYRSYAVDFDDDGLIDIWNNPVDAIGSVANYFKRHGWTANEPVVVAATATDDVPAEMFVLKRSDLQPKYTVAEFADAGVSVPETLDPEQKVTAMKFELEEGFEYWLGLDNFYVITRYNHSAMYAMSVYQLSQGIGGNITK
jgi:membrane-bound lytic murein transglycosylase B